MTRITTLYAAAALVAFFASDLQAQAQDVDVPRLSAEMKAGRCEPSTAQLAAEADRGNARAQNAMGVASEYGTCMEKSAVKAVTWYRKAAEQGVASAQLNLGFMLTNGRGVPKNEAEAVGWFRKSAEQGEAIAQSNLGYMLASGLGVPKNEAEAVIWYRKAVQQGNTRAQNRLAEAYEEGNGVGQNLILAYALYNLASATSEEARTARDRVEGQLTRAQRDEGQLISSTWKVETPFPTTTKLAGAPSKRSTQTSAASTPAAKPAAERPISADGSCRPKTASISCRSNCVNGNCVVEYENGCRVRVQVQAKFNPFNSQWEYPAPSC